MIRQRFTIPFRLPSLNEYVAANRRNPYQGAKLKKDTDESIRTVIRAAKLRHVESPCIVLMIFQEGDRRRDVDNVESAKKYALDALVTSGILHGDSPRWVIGVPSYTIYGDGCKVVVTIIESDDTSALLGMLHAGMEAVM